MTFEPAYNKTLAKPNTQTYKIINETEQKFDRKHQNRKKDICKFENMERKLCVCVFHRKTAAWLNAQKFRVNLLKRK